MDFGILQFWANDASLLFIYILRSYHHVVISGWIYKFVNIKYRSECVYIGFFWYDWFIHLSLLRGIARFGGYVVLISGSDVFNTPFRLI